MRNKNSISALFPKTRQRILSVTYGQPDRWWFLSELASVIDVTPSSLQRELGSLSECGILRSKRDGNRLYFKAESTAPIFEPLRKLVELTLGITAELKDTLRPLADKITVAFIHGSVARHEEHTLSDVDLLVVGEVGLSELSSAMRPLERRFGREINITCYGPSEFAKKVVEGNHFLTSVLKEEKTFLIGDADDVEKLSGQQDGASSYNEHPGNTRPARIGRSRSKGRRN